ncbi:MAG: hypothetical protein QOE71_3502 [Pseudonocardiales bacterium]|jgi:MFS family permease|nr:hypothetical protein [Pseudonocardiales bacterium]MDQ1752446.1 hypothetical protein [Pseudonocardiales bacterium]
MIVLLIGPFLSMLDFFITNVALPTIDRDLNASPAALELIVAGYGTAYTLFLVVGGRLGDAFGRRRLFSYGLFGFTVTSLLCGIAPGVGFLITARVVQGISAALITPQVLATFQATLTGSARSRAVSRFAATGGIAVVIGQLLGGLILQLDIAGTGWRPIFLVNVPVGVVGLLLAKRVVPDTRSSHPATIDFPGTALLGLAIVALLIPLTEGRALGWPWWIWATLAVAPVAAVALVIVERRTEASGKLPLLPPSLLRLTAMRRGLPLAVPFFMGFGAFMFVFALTVQDGLHADALHSGLLITPMAVAYFIGSLLVPRLVNRYGRAVLTTGMVLQASGLAILLIEVTSQWPHVGSMDMAPGLVVAGFGQALSVGGIFRLVLSNVPHALAGVGSGVLVTVQQGSMAIGVASLGTLFEVRAEHGFAGAFGLVLGIQVAAAVVIALASRLLPHPAS